MTRTLLGLAVVAVVTGATAARADHDEYRRAVPVQQHDCGPMPRYAPAGQNFQSGHYELQATQVWVPGPAQQVWVPGQCYQQGWAQICTQGRYEWQQSAGRYETQQSWVWVNDFREPRRHWNYGRHHRGGRFSFSVY